MNQEKLGVLTECLAEVIQSGDKQNIRRTVLLFTLITELFGFEWLELLHVQNMMRAKYGRHSKEATEAGDLLREQLSSFVRADMFADAEECKKEFIACNPANAWSTTPPVAKATEELKELVEALKRGQKSERVLDAILDVVYAGTEVKGIHY